MNGSRRISQMRILIINPNTTAAVTAHVVEQLRIHLDPCAKLLAVTAKSGEPVIATPRAFAIGAEAAMESLGEAMREGWMFDKVLLACFGDPGLEAMKKNTSAPVVGLAQACMRYAEHTALPYAVVTAGAAWDAILRQRFEQWGASSLFCGIHVLQGTGLDVFSNPLAALPAVISGIDAARAAGAQRIILGGAVFAGYKTLLECADLNTEGLLDCVECAAGALLQGQL